MPVVHFFGDSHARFNFCDFPLSIPHQNHSASSLTMHRVGRDKTQCVSFLRHAISPGDWIVYQIGEVDARCHIGKQLSAGRALDEIISTLIDSFIQSILDNIAFVDKNNDDKKQLNIVICCVPPTAEQAYYESIHGPIAHEFPFIGTDQQRAEYTAQMNRLLARLCSSNGWYFLDYTDIYKDPQTNCMSRAHSDGVHIIRETRFMTEKLLTKMGAISG
jgi:hypothetical protein